MSGVVLLIALAGCWSNDHVQSLYDRDGDGYPHPAAADVGASGPFDCDDGDAAVNPGGTESCNGIDDDCDGATDEGDAAPRVFWRDADSDGYGDPAQQVVACDPDGGLAAQAGDCDDTDGAVHPGAVEVWYDGADQDCSGGSDDDADGDGHDAIARGGDDCRDDDPDVFPGAREGWADLGVDNNCDGSIVDQARLDLAVGAYRIDGPADAAKFGAVLVLPSGWAGSEPELIATAPGLNGYQGRVYAWPASQVLSTTHAEDAPTKVDGPLRGVAPFGPDFGSAMAWCGDAATPITAVSAPGADSGVGWVYGWVGATMGRGLDASAFRVVGRAGEAFGTHLVPGLDIDGDGIADLIVGSAADGRVAANAGTAVVFLDPAGLAGDVPDSDADVMFENGVAGVHMYPMAVGDIDFDGSDDLAFGLSNPVSGTGTYLLSHPARSGTVDVPSAAGARIDGWWTGLAVGNLDNDGLPELIAAGTDLALFDLPIAGVHAVPVDARGAAGLSDASGFLEWVDIAPFGWRGPPVVTGSWRHANQTGAVMATRVAMDASTNLDDASLWAEGEFVGDAFGGSRAYADVDGDLIPELIVGATAADAGGIDSGALYVLPGPR